MFRAICCFAAVMLAVPAVAQDAPQMPRDLPMSPMPQAPVPQVPAPSVPQNVPQVMPQTLPSGVPSGGSPNQFMLECRANWSTIVFLVHPELGLVENVSSFPQWTGALFESETEYILAFAEPNGIEFVISRYTGRMTAVAEGLRVLTTGRCRKGPARALF